MKRMIAIVWCSVLALGFSNITLAAKPPSCATIQGGNLVNSVGEVIDVGNDQWGYNYQARHFKGFFCDAYRDAPWCQPYREDKLAIKWNEAWLDNKDCDGDGLLDRHYGTPSYIGSGAWLTNHMSGEYVDTNGEECSWIYFVKVVAVPTDAVEVNGVWFTAGGVEIGPVIWQQFAIIQEVSNDACAGEHGVKYHSPVGPGVGRF